MITFFHTLSIIFSCRIYEQLKLSNSHNQETPKDSGVPFTILRTT